MAVSKKGAPTSLLFSKQFWRHPLAVISGISAGGAVLGIVISALNPDALSITLLSNLATFIASGLLSYVTTHSHEKQQFAEDRAKLSDFASRRVDILSANLYSLTTEIARIQTLEETKRIVEYTLRNLAKDAELSVRDIEDMGRVEEADRPTEIPRTRLAEPVGVSESSAPNSITNEPDDVVTYSCVSCGNSNSTRLFLAVGTTKHVVCDYCHARLLLHRTSGGHFKVVDPSRGRLSNYAASETAAPITPQAEEFPETHGSFDCPRCHNRIAYSTNHNQRFVEKPCFSCFAVATYDRRSRTSTLVPDKRPVFLDSIDVESIECINCHTVFAPRKYTNVDGKDLICCFRCNTVYLDKKHLKKGIDRTCLSDGCNNIVSFKISDAENETKQFCLECMSRLVYRRDSDSVTVVEKLVVPSVTFAGFKSGGERCPHCQNQTSGRYTTNSKNQHLSICWHCKSVFELTEGTVLDYRPRSSNDGSNSNSTGDDRT